MYDSNLMALADVQAQHAIKSKTGGPFGSVIVKNGKVIAQGHNEVLKRHDPTAHGEITAIRNACDKLGTHNLSDCELYTNSYPCPMCLGAIIWSNIKTVYYGNTDKDAEDIGFRDKQIYEFLDHKNKMLDLKQHDRDLTINTFNEYKKMDHTLY